LAGTLRSTLLTQKADVVKRFDPQETPEAIGEALADLL